MDDKIDLIILGGGTGIFAAVRAAQLGLKVVLVENLESLVECIKSCQKQS